MSTTITMKASQVRALFEPILPFTDKGDSLPSLTCALITSAGGYLYATATDRYRLGVQRVKVGDSLPDGLRFLIERSSMRGILALYKVSRHDDPEMKLTIDGERLTITGAGSFGFLDSSTSWSLPGYEYPKISRLLTDAAETAGKGSKPTALNAAFLADFRAAVPRFGTNPMRVWTNGTHATFVRIGEDFIGALMAVRFSDDLTDGYAPGLGDDWLAGLGVCAPVEAEQVSA